MTLDELTLEILGKLMAQDTVNPPGNERRGALCLKEIFEREGIPCEVQELGDNRANFVAQIGSGRPILEFCGHLDVVPCEGDWTHDPLSAADEGERIYGRGACDMKGGVAAMCAAAILLHRSADPKKGTLRLSFVADEEHANLGMHAFLGCHEAADLSILGEPTELHVAVAHRGVARFYINLLGRAYHAALRVNEETAVTKAARAVLAVNEMNRTLLETKHPILPPPSIVVTEMKGYEKDNIVPACIQLLTDYRILPGTTEEQSRENIRRTLDEAGIMGYEIEKRFYMPGGESHAGSPFAKLCCQVAAEANHRTEEPCAFNASCELCFLVKAGADTVILGPGSLEQAHTVEEFVEKTQLFRAAAIYRGIARRVLGF